MFGRDYLSLNLVKKDPYVVTNHIIFNDQKREKLITGGKSYLA